MNSFYSVRKIESCKHNLYFMDGPVQHRTKASGLVTARANGSTATGSTFKEHHSKPSKTISVIYVINKCELSLKNSAVIFQDLWCRVFKFPPSLNAPI